jgi:hypothetical protein
LLAGRHTGETVTWAWFQQATAARRTRPELPRGVSERHAVPEGWPESEVDAAWLPAHLDERPLRPANSGGVRRREWTPELSA